MLTDDTHQLPAVLAVTEPVAPAGSKDQLTPATTMTRAQRRSAKRSTSSPEPAPATHPTELSLSLPRPSPELQAANALPAEDADDAEAGSVIGHLVGSVRALPAAIVALPGRIRDLPAATRRGIASVRANPRRVIRPLAATTVFAALLGVGLAVGTKPALAPLTAPGAELVSAQGADEDRLADQVASRSEVVRRSASRDVQDLEVTTATNSSVSLSWLNPELGDGESIVARRADGAQAPGDVKAGKPVELTSASSSALVDRGLTPGKEYSYALFVVDADGNARLTAVTTAQTRVISDVLEPGDTLLAGQQLTSAKGGYTLRMTGGGDVQLRDGRDNVIWSTATSAKGGHLSMVADGNLAVIDGRKIAWQTKTSGHAGAKLQLLADGDIAIVKNQKKIWSRHDLGNMVQGDDYPWPTAGGGWSPLRYGYRQCTDFAAWRLNVQAGRTKAPWKYDWASMTPRGGNAGQWAQYFPDKIDDTPKLGAVAWWDGKNFGSGLGHVAIVSAIWPDGSITIEEYNVNPRAYGTRHLYPNGKPGTAAWPNHFIHIQDL